MSNDSPEPRTLKTIETASEVIDALAERDGAGVTELAGHLGTNKSTVHAYLTTLEKCDFVVCDDGHYQLSYQFLLIGEHLRENSHLYQMGRSEVKELAEEVGHYAHLVVEEDGKAVSIYQTKGEKAADYEYQQSKLQRRDPLHVTAAGKAIMAHLPQDTVTEIIDEHGLGRWTDNTITDREALFEELESVREQGIAYNDEEEVVGFRAVAAPVRTADGTVLGSVTVSGPVGHLTDDVFQEQLPAEVASIANSIEVRINMANKNPNFAPE